MLQAEYWVCVVLLILVQTQLLIFIIEFNLRVKKKMATYFLTMYSHLQYHVTVISIQHFRFRWIMYFLIVVILC